jgi:hypothetical protein
MQEILNRRLWLQPDVVPTAVRVSFALITGAHDTLN